VPRGGRGKEAVFYKMRCEHDVDGGNHETVKTRDRGTSQRSHMKDGRAMATALDLPGSEFWL